MRPLTIAALISICLWQAVAGALAGDAPLAGAAWSPTREWAPGEKDGSVHCLGNGRLCAYAQGPDIIQLFGPTYSTTTIGSLTLRQPGVTCQSRRVMGAAIWRHTIQTQGQTIAVITDFVDTEEPAFIRQMEITAPLEFAFHPDKGIRMTANDAAMQAAGANAGFLTETPIGRPSVPFGNYPIPFAFFHQFAWRGNVERIPGTPSDTIGLRFLPGPATLYITGGPGLADCIANMKEVLAIPYDDTLARTRASWAAFTAKGDDFAAQIPSGVPMRERLLQVLDDVAVLIKAQQAAEGGIIAGYPYHLGYVRDQYGTHRGLVALGHEEMSRDILGFYYNVFKAHGQIHNAQAFGIPGLFHVHENDEVEITGYITLQAFDYLARSNDVPFIREIFPMLDWAYTVQQRHFISGMLPFNGDETYVAGSILPRSALNDGSAEATMLFIDTGRLMLDFAQRESLWAPARLADEEQTIQRIRGAYRDNFWRNGRLITNNPARSQDPSLLPSVRHGVCESCITVQWTLRNENARYTCLECMNKPPLPPVEPTVYTLQSVGLTPLYFHSTLFDKEELRPQVEDIIQAYKATGKLPSRPDSDIAVGYDYGLVLYALTELGHPMAPQLYEKTLALADDTGAWAEYYRDHKPTGTRCRPWESAINIEAILHWIEKAYP